MTYARSALLLSLLATLGLLTALPAADPPQQRWDEAAQTWVDVVAQAPPAPAPQQYAKGYIPLTPEKKAAYHAKAAAAHGFRIGMKMQNQTLPAAFDCRTVGWSTPIGDQANCGSCYLCSTVQTASAAFVKAGYGKPDGSFLLSRQFGMDCHNFGGCGGGNGTEVIDWMVTNGFPAESYVDLNGNVVHDYPAYTASSGSCKLKQGAKLWRPASWGFCTSDQSNRPATTQELKTAMFNYGTLNVSLDAGGQFMNGSGTITSLGNNIDHEIQMVAWDDSDGTFLLQNQWGTGWGVNGYRKVTYAAAAHLVDAFWVTATPVPPPVPPIPPIPPGPVPPIPPGPTPSGLTVTFPQAVPAGQYELNTPGTAAKAAKYDEIEKITQTKQQQPAKPEAAPPAKPMPQGPEKERQALDAAHQGMYDALVAAYANAANADAIRRDAHDFFLATQLKDKDAQGRALQRLTDDLAKPMPVGPPAEPKRSTRLWRPRAPEITQVANAS